MHDCLRSLTLCLAWWKWRENGGRGGSRGRGGGKGRRRGRREGEALLKLSRMFRNTTLLSVPLRWSVKKGRWCRGDSALQEECVEAHKESFRSRASLLCYAKHYLYSMCQHKWNLLFSPFTPLPQLVGSNSISSRMVEKIMPSCILTLNPSSEPTSRLQEIKRKERKIVYIVW